MKRITNQLYRNLCNRAVTSNKRFLVDSHRNTSKHQKALGSRFFTVCVSHASKFSAHICFCRKKLFHFEKKLLAKDKKFKVENVKHHMILHFNAFTW